jgi:hypothetical protein
MTPAMVGLTDVSDCPKCALLAEARKVVEG